MARRWSSPLGLGSVASAMLLFMLLPLLIESAPWQDSADIQHFTEGCYYNYNHYTEGDRIITNEPCLNCTCHNKMLMCYLRVCPFTKPFGHECVVEKREDQCCPIITCPQVAVDIEHHLSELGTELSIPEKYGCSINQKFYPEGAQVPSNPNKPCELCYCIKNRTSCLMQECTLHIEGYTPIYNKGSCCPVRYNCDHENDVLELTDQSTSTTTTMRPTPGFVLTTSMRPSLSNTDCIHDGVAYADGASLRGRNPCEHCYCMRGDIVCAVQECEVPMLSASGKSCHPVPPSASKCCPSQYMCEDDSTTTEIIDATSMPSTDASVNLATDAPLQDIHSFVSDEDLQLQTHIDDNEKSSTGKPKGVSEGDVGDNRVAESTPAVLLDSTLSVTDKQLIPRLHDVDATAESTKIAHYDTSTNSLETVDITETTAQTTSAYVEDNRGIDATTPETPAGDSTLTNPSEGGKSPVVEVGPIQSNSNMESVEVTTYGLFEADDANDSANHLKHQSTEEMTTQDIAELLEEDVEGEPSAKGTPSTLTTTDKNDQIELSTTGNLQTEHDSRTVTAEYETAIDSTTPQGEETFEDTSEGTNLIKDKKSFASNSRKTTKEAAIPEAFEKDFTTAASTSKHNEGDVEDEHTVMATTTGMTFTDLGEVQGTEFGEAIENHKTNDNVSSPNNDKDAGIDNGSISEYNKEHSFTENPFESNQLSEEITTTYQPPMEQNPDLGFTYQLITENNRKPNFAEGPVTKLEQDSKEFATSTTPILNFSTEDAVDIENIKTNSTPAANIDRMEDVTIPSDEDEKPDFNLEKIPAIIPGEGDCLVEELTYQNNSVVPSLDQCKMSCMCISSIVICQEVKCEIPEEISKCVLDPASVNKCCPVYTCGTEALPMVTSDILNKSENIKYVAVTKDTVKVSTEGPKENVRSSTPVAIMPTDFYAPALSTEESLSHVKEEISKENTFSNYEDVSFTTQSTSNDMEEKYVATATSSSEGVEDFYSKISTSTNNPENQHSLYTKEQDSSTPSAGTDLVYSASTTPSTLISEETSIRTESITTTETPAAHEKGFFTESDEDSDRTFTPSVVTEFVYHTPTRAFVNTADTIDDITMQTVNSDTDNTNNAVHAFLSTTVFPKDHKENYPTEDNIDEMIEKPYKESILNSGFEVSTNKITTEQISHTFSNKAEGEEFAEQTEVPTDGQQVEGQLVPTAGGSFSETINPENRDERKPISDVTETNVAIIDETSKVTEITDTANTVGPLNYEGSSAAPVNEVEKKNIHIVSNTEPQEETNHENAATEDDENKSIYDTSTFGFISQDRNNTEDPIYTFIAHTISPTANTEEADLDSNSLITTKESMTSKDHITTATIAVATDRVTDTLFHKGPLTTTEKEDIIDIATNINASFTYKMAVESSPNSVSATTIPSVKSDKADQIADDITVRSTNIENEEPTTANIAPDKSRDNEYIDVAMIHPTSAPDSTTSYTKDQLNKKTEVFTNSRNDVTYSTTFDTEEIQGVTATHPPHITLSTSITIQKENIGHNLENGRVSSSTEKIQTDYTLTDIYTTESIDYSIANYTDSTVKLDETVNPYQTVSLGEETTKVTTYDIPGVQTEKSTDYLFSTTPAVQEVEVASSTADGNIQELTTEPILSTISSEKKNPQVTTDTIEIHVADPLTNSNLHIAESTTNDISSVYENTQGPIVDSTTHDNVTPGKDENNVNVNTSPTTPTNSSLLDVMGLGQDNVEPNIASTTQVVTTQQVFDPVETSTLTQFSNDKTGEGSRKDLNRNNEEYLNYNPTEQYEKNSNLSATESIEVYVTTEDSLFTTNSVEEFSVDALGTSTVAIIDDKIKVLHETWSQTNSPFSDNKDMIDNFVDMSLPESGVNTVLNEKRTDLPSVDNKNEYPEKTLNKSVNTFTPNHETIRTNVEKEKQHLSVDGVAPVLKDSLNALMSTERTLIANLHQFFEDKTFSIYKAEKQSLGASEIGGVTNTKGEDMTTDITPLASVTGTSKDVIDDQTSSKSTQIDEETTSAYDVKLTSDMNLSHINSSSIAEDTNSLSNLSSASSESSTVIEEHFTETTAPAALAEKVNLIEETEKQAHSEEEVTSDPNKENVYQVSSFPIDTSMETDIHDKIEEKDGISSIYRPTTNSSIDLNVSLEHSKLDNEHATIEDVTGSKINSTLLESSVTDSNQIAGDVTTIAPEEGTHNNTRDSFEDGMGNGSYFTPEEVEVPLSSTQYPLESYNLDLTTAGPIIGSMENSNTTAKDIDEASTATPTTTIGDSRTTTTSTTKYPQQAGSYGQSPQYPSYPEDEYTDEDETEVFGPGTCRYGGKLFVSAQQIPRDDPCDFCFCFRSDIICLQQSCPPPITGCHEEPISGFCCPRYECPVSMATVLNITTSTTTTSTTLPPHFLQHAYEGAAERKGCHINGKSYHVGQSIDSTSGPCMHCTCGGDGQMKCNPKTCSPEPMLRQMIAVVSSRRR